MAVFSANQNVPLQLMLNKTSSHGSAVHLQHPTPDQQAGRMDYFDNVQRLEQTAERMSASGSDIGEQIRKLREEPRRPGSRAYSFDRPRSDAEPENLASSRSRNVSTSSHVSSIAHVNGTARWGGYSPNGYITSPAGSFRSASWSQSSIWNSSSIRKSRATPLTGLQSESTPLDVPKASPTPESLLPSESFEASYLKHFEGMDGRLEKGVGPTSDPSQLAESSEQERKGDVEARDTGLPDRPRSGASNDTFKQTNSIFVDFDGAHYAPSMTNSVMDTEQPGPEAHPASLAWQEGLQHLYAEPAPGDHMVYYPAPVPITINLPERLSQAPSENASAKRRSRSVARLSVARNSPSQEETAADGQALLQGTTNPKRKSIADFRRSGVDLSSLPPQLRASVFFEHQRASPQEIEIKDQSAAATLEGILNASVEAPVGAFTDHPITGRPVSWATKHSRSRSSVSRGDSELGAQKSQSTTPKMDKQAAFAEKSNSEELPNEREDPRKSRTSLLLSYGKRFSSNQIKKFHKRQSSGTSMLKGLGSRQSNGNLERTALDDTQHTGISDSPTPSSKVNGWSEGEALQENDGEPPQETDETTSNHDVAAEEECDEERPMYVRPNTLMAEIDIRKHHQRKRNLTAADAFPNGMHTTLLEQDAVRQVEKEARKNHRVNLAWDNDTADIVDNDDVPLGYLFPQYNGNGLFRRKLNSSAPNGLMEQREVEDNEPLSKRRDRLRGTNAEIVQAAAARGIRDAGIFDYLANVGVGGGSDDGGEETLAQRKQRFEGQSTLNAALGDIGRPESRAFTDDVISQFGALEVKEDEKSALKETIKVTIRHKAKDSEDETLAQRRKRLQAAAAALEGTILKPQEISTQISPSNPDISSQPPTRPPLSTSYSLGNVLPAASNGMHGLRIASNNGQVKEGILLQFKENVEGRHRRGILDANKRASSLSVPLINPTLKMVPGTANGPGQSEYFSTLPSYQNPPVQTPAHTPMSMPTQPFVQMPMHAPTGLPYMLPQNALPYYNPNSMQHYAMPDPFTSHSAANPMPLADAFGNAGMVPTIQQMGPQMDPMLEPRRRDLIDRWRQSVMQ